MLVVALQVVGAKWAENGSDASNPQCSGQEANVEEDLLFPGLQVVDYIVSIHIEVLKRKCHHWKHSCA